MKCWKKGLALLTAAGMTAGMLTGCGGSAAEETQKADGASAQTQTEAASEDQVVLRFAWWGGEERHNATLEAIAKYQELNPHVVIEPEYGGFDGYQQKLITQLSGQTAADIVQIDQPWLADINKQGDLLLDLNKEDAVDKTQFDQNLLNNCLVFDGKLVGVPTGVNNNVLLYNKAVFPNGEVGPDTILTWDEMTEMGAKMHEENPDFYLLNCEQTILNLMLHSYLHQQTGEYIFNENYERTFTEEQLRDGLEIILTWVEKGVIEPAEVNTLYLNRWYENPKWIEGNMGLLQVWLASQSTAAVNGTLDIGVMPMLREKDAVGSGVMVRPSQVYSVPSSTKHPEEALKFMNWMVNDPEAAAILRDTRGVPGSKAAREVLLEQGILSAENNAVVENAIAAGAMAIPNLPTGDMEQLWLDAIQEVEYKVATPEEEAKKLIEEFDELLAELKSNQ